MRASWGSKAGMVVVIEVTDLGTENTEAVADAVMVGNAAVKEGGIAAFVVEAVAGNYGCWGLASTSATDVIMADIAAVDVKEVHTVN